MPGLEVSVTGHTPPTMSRPFETEPSCWITDGGQVIVEQMMWYLLRSAPWAFIDVANATIWPGVRTMPNAVAPEARACAAGTVMSVAVKGTSIGLTVVSPRSDAWCVPRPM